MKAVVRVRVKSAQKRHGTDYNQLLEQQVLERHPDWPRPVRELIIPGPRKFRFDLAFPTHKVLVEIQGGIWARKKLGHNTGSGITRDCNKANYALLSGWHLLLFIPQDIFSGIAVDTIEQALLLFPEVTPVL